MMSLVVDDKPSSEIYTLSLHDALPISAAREDALPAGRPNIRAQARRDSAVDDDRAAPLERRDPRGVRSEEHTSELQSRLHLVCRLLLEKKKKKSSNFITLVSCTTTLYH